MISRLKIHKPPQMQLDSIPFHDTELKMHFACTEKLHKNISRNFVFAVCVWETEKRIDVCFLFHDRGFSDASEGI